MPPDPRNLTNRPDVIPYHLETGELRGSGAGSPNSRTRLIYIEDGEVIELSERLSTPQGSLYTCAGSARYIVPLVVS